MMIVKTAPINLPKNTVNFRIALQRTTLALNQLDRLCLLVHSIVYVKWLKEKYSSETGFSAEVQISNDVSSIIKGMIHDQIRAFMAQVNANMPELYPMMFDNNVIFTGWWLLRGGQSRRIFYTADIDLYHWQRLILQSRHWCSRLPDDNDEFEGLILIKWLSKEKGFGAVE